MMTILSILLAALLAAPTVAQPGSTIRMAVTVDGAGLRGVAPLLPDGWSVVAAGAENGGCDSHLCYVDGPGRAWFDVRAPATPGPAVLRASIAAPGGQDAALVETAVTVGYGVWLPITRRGGNA